MLAGAVVFATLVVAAWAAAGAARPGAHLLGLASGLALAAVSLAAIRKHVPGWSVVAAAYATAIGAVLLNDDPTGAVVFTAVWLHYFTDGIASVIITGRRSLLVPVAGCAGFSLTVDFTHPGWELPSAAGQLICGLSIVVASRVALAVLADIARRVDDTSAAAAREAEAISWSRHASEEAAETARLMHDTVVNTLGAIASGGGAVRDLDAVQERCARDADVLTRLAEGGPEPDTSPLAVIHASPLEIRRSGLTDEEVRLSLDDLPAATVQALGRCLSEALQNVVKHAQVSSASLDVAVTEAGLQIRLRDAGVGFDPDHTPLRGLRSSVIERARAVGIDAQVESAVGSGTTVSLTVLRAQAESDSPEGDALDSDQTSSHAIDVLRDRAVLAWAAAVVAVGPLLEVLTVPGLLTPTYGVFLMGTMGLCLVIGLHDRGSRARSVTTVVLVALVPAGFVVSAATSGFGRIDPVGWQVVSHTGPLILLIRFGTRHGWIAGLVAHLVAGAALALVVAERSVNAAAIMLIGTLIGATLVIGWVSFDRFLTVSARRLARDEDARRLAAVEAGLLHAATAARARWRDASLASCRDLLRGLGSGTLHPDDPDVRSRCAEEESHLRQITQLDPHLVRLSPWIVEALGEARRREVSLVVRVGATETAESDGSAPLGHFLSTTVRHVPTRTHLTASFFGHGRDLTLRLVSEHPILTQYVAQRPLPPGLTATSSHHGRQDLLEVSVADHHVAHGGGDEPTTIERPHLQELP